jgi:N-methylhydantoinase A/oxoprolinase/acetone carboxylase beta subunit
VALAEAPVEAAICDRARLGAADRIEGPAILVQRDATSLILPGQYGEVHRSGSIVVRDRSPIDG